MFSEQLSISFFFSIVTFYLLIFLTVLLCIFSSQSFVFCHRQCFSRRLIIYWYHLKMMTLNQWTTQMNVNQWTIENEPTTAKLKTLQNRKEKNSIVLNCWKEIWKKKKEAKLFFSSKFKDYNLTCSVKLANKNKKKNDQKLSHFSTVSCRSFFCFWLTFSSVLFLPALTATNSDRIHLICSESDCLF